jgi:arylsulfatase A-like enzyme
MGRIMSLAATVLVILGAGISCSKPDTPPNIILCMADDQGWGDMGYNGHPVILTPNFDLMAGEGMRFDRFYAAAPVCSPTRGSVMTGRHPNRFGCFSWGYTLRPQEVTLAEALKQAGYVTGHFGKWHLGSVYKGTPADPGSSGFDEWFSAPNFFDNDPVMSREGVAVRTSGESSMVTVNAALEFIEKHAGTGQPFFAVVWFGSPHNPHQAAEEDRMLFDTGNEELDNFYGEIAGMDRAFGKLRNSLRTLGIEQHTILWYCSDNGGLPRLGSTGGRGNKASIYEGGLRVPAMIQWPERIREPGVTDIPCNTCDIYPTLMELAGVSMPGQPPLDGISLAGLMDGNMDRRPEPMGFWSYPAPGIRTPSLVWMAEMLEVQEKGLACSDSFHLRLDAGQITRVYPADSLPGHAAWLDWPWKLHRIEVPGTTRYELYRLDDDPMEASDLSERNQEQLQKMKAELEAWQRSVIRSLNGEDYK